MVMKMVVFASSDVGVGGWAGRVCAFIQGQSTIQATFCCCRCLTQFAIGCKDDRIQSQRVSVNNGTKSKPKLFYSYQPSQNDCVWFESKYKKYVSI